ncbi:MAG: tRNA lysidine(34) synthetase TilS [Rhodospirillum sp.]|nr:tRNA lysidine(34) synthetase TilS [Rhodospirillum sp.]MCF8489796.1 tRNA lysidine(34) synthetase TilS [Rhodospirillum sp.]MCF8500508.1 tRNA lysidine(34) synthetase TilS [Rhodospirillum sp.]
MTGPGEGTAPPLTGEAFSALMAPLGPFEPAPLLAVACSGGVDSMVLLALATDWAVPRGGAVLALCFDHGLRPESAAEAQLVAEVARTLGQRAAILTWDEEKPRTGVHERAREARLRSLLSACAEAGALHLLLAHHGDDQAETVWQRLARGSGPDGLAAMAPVSPRREARLLRPFLSLTKARLRATALSRGLVWAEDPSNASLKYERGRQRAAWERREDLGLTLAGLRALADRAGWDRAWIDGRLTRRLAEVVSTLGEGWVRLDRAKLLAGEVWETARALARLAGSLSGAGHGADPRPIADLLTDLPGPGKSRSVAGLLWRAEGAGRLLVCRECRGLDRRLVDLPPGCPVVWDGRYIINAEYPGLVVSALGESGWAALAREVGAGEVPRLAGLALPAVRDRTKALDPRGILAVPSLGFWRYSATLEDSVSMGDDAGYRGEQDQGGISPLVSIAHRPHLPIGFNWSQGSGRRL